MATIVTRTLDKETFSKTEKYLQKNGEILEENLYGHFLVLEACKDDEQVVDAIVHLDGNRISIKYIWIMEYDAKEGMHYPRNTCGEKGNYAKILGEKYFNHFFENLATADIDNFEQWQWQVTADSIQKAEAEIDQRVNPEQLTEIEINAYDQIELILSAENALRYLCEGLGEKDYNVAYNNDTKVFQVEFRSSKFNIRIPLGDVVRKKWETGECFAKAALICESDLYLAADKKRAREAHYTKELLKQVIPALRKVARQDKVKFEGLKNQYIKVVENQITLYDEGMEHSEAGREKWSRIEFLAQHQELVPQKHASQFIDMLYLTYCDGFAKSNGDSLFSGKGGIRILDYSIGQG